ncbi:acVLRF1 family peptidyl-tRNA hydrolase [Geodermatophilus sp. DSM 44513]|uniref:acVLRF1 family peptidyl-tRNA hydrolase n=1 Tax=Geodermatophilus sp. DSM 44513 TaxID=1528104 RepID=UPI0028F72B46|nr:acVLRF1 family peptidyl-tRNA hydrolase [Geodermatophilus sp. DSM 44513]WNV77902.1 acVLRF1 family peptidyl-tRNA hydrolase [Geodermatophilus sp. DSM 44513]
MGRRRAAHHPGQRLTRPRPAAGGGRQLRVPPERLGRWLDGVAARHGTFDTVEPAGEGVRVVCADTTEVVLRAPFGWRAGPALLSSFSAAARVPHRAAVLLVRRGRWAVGVFDGGDLVASKVDARQVQGRTAAGGWSQQRFARRRAHQTDAVVDAAVETAVRVLAPHAGGVEALFSGGDRGLVDDVLADPRLRALAALRREPALEVGEPTKAVLLTTPQQFRAVEVHIVEPGDRPSP